MLKRLTIAALCLGTLVLFSGCHHRWKRHIHRHKPHHVDVHVDVHKHGPGKVQIRKK